MRLLSVRALVLLAFFLFALPIVAPASEPVDLTILHINDFHGRLLPYIVKSVDEKTPVGGAAYLAWIIRERRAGNPEGTLLLSAGDMFQGTPASNIFRGKPVMEFMNHLGFDAMVIGNHEFDWGLDVLQKLREAAAFPFLSANILDRQGRGLPGVKPYIMVERKGVKIAVIGITTPETSYTTKPDIVKELIFAEPERALPGLIREVKEKGAKLVIVLSHLGFDIDKQVAKTVKGIDVIVGGHSHTAVAKPALVGGTIVVQAGYNGIYLGVLDLKIDPETGAILDYTKEDELLVVLAGQEKGRDEKVETIANSYNDKLKESFSEVVAETSVDLVRNYNAESNIGNLVTDAMREASGADIALQSSGGIRTDIPKGKITMEQGFSLLPFDSVVMTIELTGRQILEVLEQSATLEMGMLQVSGIRVTYDLAKPASSRVLDVSVGDKPLKMDETYKVAINDFLAAGGDRFVTFKEGRNPVYGDVQRDAFVAYLRKHSPVSPGVEGRSVTVR